MRKRPSKLPFLALLIACGTASAQQYVDLPDGLYTLFGAANNSSEFAACGSSRSYVTYSENNGRCTVTNTVLATNPPATGAACILSPQHLWGTFYPIQTWSGPGEVTGRICIKNRIAHFIAGSKTHRNQTIAGWLTIEESIDRDGRYLRHSYEDENELASEYPENVRTACGLSERGRTVTSRTLLSAQFNVASAPFRERTEEAFFYEEGSRYVLAPWGGSPLLYYSLLEKHGMGLARIGNLVPECNSTLSLTHPGSPGSQGSSSLSSVAGITAGAVGLSISFRSESSVMPTASLQIVSGSADSQGQLTGPTIREVPGGFFFTWIYDAPERVMSARPAQVEVVVDQGATRSRTQFPVYARPLVFVHGLWGSSASFALFAQFADQTYPAATIQIVNYGDLSSESYMDPRIQTRIAEGIRSAVHSARARRIVTNSVDVVGHSLGGLAVAATMRNQPALPIAHFITVGTPKRGSPLATWLSTNKDQPFCNVGGSGSGLGIILESACTISGLTVGDLMRELGMPVGPAIDALTPGNQALDYVEAQLGSSISVSSVGNGNILELVFPKLSEIAGAPSTIDAMLGPSNDTVVPLTSQTAIGQQSLPTLNDLVHSPPPFVTRPGAYQLGSESTYRQVLARLGRSFGSSPPARMAPTAIDALDELKSLDLTSWTRISAPSALVTPATAIAFTQIQLNINSPIGCIPIKAYAYDFRGFASISQSPFILPLIESAPGSQRIGILGLCEGNQYFSLLHSIDRQVPTSARITFEPEFLMPVLGGQATFRVFIQADTERFDVTESASYLVENTLISRVPYPGTIEGVGVGVTNVRAFAYGIGGTTSVVISDELRDELIFQSGFEK
jgi:pimeloyl-ACP methyl ester carboxylesterase